MKWAVLVFAIVALVDAAIASFFAPYVFAELSPWLEPHRIVDPAPVKLVRGRMVDDYFAVQYLGAGTYAIGEPRYYQQNYAYLILGRDRALLFDTGSGTRDISGVVDFITHLPVTVMVSHLHFDHLGGVAPFHSIAMIDLPQTRADVAGGIFTPGRYEYLGLIDRRGPPSFRVTEWLKPGATIDLGGRKLTILSTPGHTPTSVALFDPAKNWLFIGDFLYPTTLYAFLPGASISAYQATAERLLRTLPADTILWTAHCCRAQEGIQAPWLDMTNLRDLDRALTGIRARKAQPTGFYPWRYPVDSQMTLAAGFPWNNP